VHYLSIASAEPPDGLRYSSLIASQAIRRLCGGYGKVMHRLCGGYGKVMHRLCTASSFPPDSLRYSLLIAHLSCSS
jgi:hypothetical protein